MVGGNPQPRLVRREGPLRRGMNPTHTPAPRKTRRNHGHPIDARVGGPNSEHNRNVECHFPGIASAAAQRLLILPKIQAPAIRIKLAKLGHFGDTCSARFLLNPAYPAYPSCTLRNSLSRRRRRYGVDAQRRHFSAISRMCK